MSYYYSSDKDLSDADKDEQQRLENELCNLTNVTEIGAHGSHTSVTIKKNNRYVEVIIEGDNIEMSEQ